MGRTSASGRGRGVARGAVPVCADAGQKARAELLEFAQAPPLDLQERLLGGRALPRHLAQARVAEDEVGRETSLFGHGPAEGAECLEQVLVDRPAAQAGRRGRACGPGGGGPRGRGGGGGGGGGGG